MQIEINFFQMRFQQKTQEEQEHRRNELSQTVAASPKAASSRLIGNGKVRQMFDERRRGAGIDRSNPLKPISDTRAHALQQHQSQLQITKGLSTMSLKEKPVSARHLTSDSNNNNSSSSKYNAAGTGVNGNRLKPVITRKTPPKKEKETPTRANSSPPSSARVSSMRTTTTPAAQAVRPPLVRVPLSERGRVSPPKARQVSPISLPSFKYSKLTYFQIMKHTNGYRSIQNLQ